MRFFVGDQLVGEDSAGPEWSVPVTLDESGIQSLIVVATNSAGEQMSAFRAIVVQPALIPEPSGLVLLAFPLCGCSVLARVMRASL